MKAAVFGLVATLAVAGCATWETTSLPKDVKNQEISADTDPSQIQVTESDLSGRSYTRLGDLEVTVNKTTALHPNPTREQVIEKLRIDAAKLGANAVISTQISDVQISAFSWGSRKGTGTAVRLAQ